MYDKKKKRERKRNIHSLPMNTQPVCNDQSVISPNCNEGKNKTLKITPSHLTILITHIYSTLRHLAPVASIFLPFKIAFSYVCRRNPSFLPRSLSYNINVKRKINPI